VPGEEACEEKPEQGCRESQQQGDEEPESILSQLKLREMDPAEYARIAHTATLGGDARGRDVRSAHGAARRIRRHTFAALWAMGDRPRHVTNYRRLS
jgi:hypothetical protein